MSNLYKAPCGVYLLFRKIERNMLTIIDMASYTSTSSKVTNVIDDIG